MKIHYNNALQPERDKAIACMVGSTSERSFDRLPVTVDEDAVTCKRCLKAFGIDAK